MGTVPQGELCQQIGLDGLDRCKEFGRILFIHTIPIPLVGRSAWWARVVEARTCPSDPTATPATLVVPISIPKTIVVGLNLEDNGLHDGR